LVNQRRDHYRVIQLINPVNIPKTLLRREQTAP